MLENILLRGGWMLWPGVAFKIQEKREESLRAVSGVRTGDSNKAHPLYHPGQHCRWGCAQGQL